MHLQSRYGLMLAACLAAAGPALAQIAPQGLLLGQREVVRARLEGLAQEELKAVFLRCSEEAGRRMVALDEGALCALTQDVLKERAFDGDFNSLVAWWKVQRDRALPAPTGKSGSGEQ